jgi:MEMO1 family protein
LPILGAFIVPHPPLIIPSVGRGQQAKVQATIDAYGQVSGMIAAIAPETIVVISPHSIQYSDYIHISPGERARGDLGAFGAPGAMIEKEYDTALARAIADAAEHSRISAGMKGEKNKALDHGTIVPLWFVENRYSRYKIIRVSLSGLSLLEHYTFGQCIARGIETLNRQAVIIASGDLSHKLAADGPYGFAEEGPAFDKAVTAAMRSGDFMRFLTLEPDFCEEAAECGLRSFITMAGALDGMAVKANFLSYEGVTGVGYAVCAYIPDGPDPARKFGDEYFLKRQESLQVSKTKEDTYVSLARRTLEQYVRDGVRPAVPEGLPGEMLTGRAGVFVSLKKDGRLRGCIGTISPTRASIAEEIISNAISAGTNDPRFDPVTEDELDSLVYSVDVLKKPEPIASMSDLDVKRYGVIVSKSGRRGLLLPNLEGIDTPQKQVEIALGKAGLSHNDNYSMERFEVVRHK